MSKLSKIIFFAIFGITFPIANVLAQVDFKEIIQPEKGKPINIKSENLIIKNRENLAIFTDNVRVTQGKMLLKSNQVRLYSDYNEKSKKSKFKHIEAEGNVDFKSEDKSVKSDHADYDVIRGILLLTGNVVISESDKLVEGKTFVYDVNTGRSEIRNSSFSNAGEANKSSDNTSEKQGRVRAVFTPDEETNGFQLPISKLEAVKGKEKKDDHQNVEGDNNTFKSPYLIEDNQNQNHNDFEKKIKIDK